MSSLSIHLLGSPRIEVNGKPITVDTRKAVALLAYLATIPGEHREHRRESLAALLWPDVDQSHAFSALRRTLSALNKAIGGQGLIIERESIALAAGADIWIDTAEFKRRLAECRTHGHAANEVCARCVKPLTEASKLYRGDFLAGFNLRDSGDFDDWTFFEAEHLRRELVSILDRLVRHHLARREYEAGIAFARRWITIDPLHEPAHRELMRLYALADQRAAALRQYQACVHMLKQELDVEPLAETTQLYESIKANKLKAAKQLPPAAIHDRPAAGSPPYPFVGRAHELNTLLQMYAASRYGRFMAIEGEAGIGKTRLVEEFLNRVRDQAGAIISARCYDGEAALPYQLFINVLRTAMASSDRLSQLQGLPAVWISEAVRLVPELSAFRADLPIAPPLEYPGAQGRFLEGVTQVLLALCQGAADHAAAILFLDDLHWLDESSLDLLIYFVRRLRGQALMVIAAWRTENLPDRHPLRTLAADAQRSGLGAQLLLSTLNQAQVVELTRAVWPASVNLAERLYRETEGQPYFVIEYLEAMRAQPETDWSMPRSVRDLLLARLSGVSETGRQLVQTAVVIGRSFDLETLREASGRSEDETVAALEELIAARLIREHPARDQSQPEYDFNHEKMREAIYEELSLARRRLLHERVAKALAARERGLRQAGPLSGQIAQHYQLAGRRTEAAGHFYQAGEYARSLYANAEALAYYQAALAAGYADAAGLHERLGDLQTLRGEYRAALQSYETAAALDRTQAAVLARLEHKLGQVHQRQGLRELAEGHYAAALRILDAEAALDTRVQRAQVYIDWSLNAQHRGETDRAIGLAQQALNLAEAAADRHTLAQAHNVLGVLARHQVDFNLAEHHLHYSLAIADELHDRIARVAALNNLSLVYSDQGDVAQAIALTEQALQECVAAGDRHREAALHNNLADLLHAADKSDEAMAHLKQAVAIFAEIGIEAGTMQPEIWKLTEW